MMPTVRSRACTDCGKQYDVTAFELTDREWAAFQVKLSEMAKLGLPVEHTRELTTLFLGLDGQMENEDGPLPICPGCGCSEYRSILSAVRLQDIAGYPYFDAGAGREFASATERRKWMKDNNKVCLEGELENHQAGILREAEKEAAKHDAVYAEMNRSVGSDPEYLNARDKGLAPSLGVQEAKKS